MALIKINSFLGENQALHPAMLPDGYAQVSLNQKPGRGDFRPWNAPLTLGGISLVGSCKTIYRLGLDVQSETQYWLGWNSYVSVVRGFNADDPSELTCFTSRTTASPFTPKYTNKWIAISGATYPTVDRELGLPAPTSAITVTDLAVGTAALSETRFFVYTYVNSLGWESAPSPVSTIKTCKTDATLTLSGFVSPPAGNYDINRIRVYKTQTSGSSTSFFFLRELGTVSGALTSITLGTTYKVNALGTTDFTTYGATAPVAVGDTFVANVSATLAGTGTVTTTTVSTASTTDDLRSLGETLPSTTWLPAPGIPQGGLFNLTEPYLTCLTGMWNGMMAGIVGRSVRICEPYQPYAWPLAYEILPPESTPVALGTFGQTLVILTNMNPILATGGAPDSMDEQPLDFSQACIAPLSVVSMGQGVVYASPDGLCYVGAGGSRLLTKEIMTRDDWQALNPANIIGYQYEGRYIATFGPANSITRLGNSIGGFVFEPENPRGIYFLDSNYLFTNAYTDPYADKAYVLTSGGAIQKWDAGAASNATLRTKLFRLPKPMQAFACAQVAADSYPLTLRVYSDAGALKHTQTVTSREAFRLPGGFYQNECYFEISGTRAVQELAVAHSMQELAQ